MLFRCAVPGKSEPQTPTTEVCANSHVRRKPMDTETPPSMKTTTIVAVKRGLLLYWALWCTIVLATHVILELKELGLLRQFDVPLVSSSAANFGVAAGERGAWRLGVITWEGAAALAFWIVFRRFRGRTSIHPGALAAPFILAFTLFGVFVVADRWFLNVSSETTHLRILAALCISFLVVFYLPE